jgi:anti-sigma factor RsiW
VIEVNCEKINDLLHAYLDDELDLAHRLDIERHLKECSTCALALEAQEQLRTALRAPQHYHRAPAHLAERVRAMEHRPDRSRRQGPARRWRALAIAASLVLAVFLGWGIGRWTTRPPRDDLIAQAVLSNHLRSLLASHLLDVPSRDQHQVKPWFNGLVDFSPPVKNLAEQGFPLIGGRLEYINGRNVAVLVYKRREHVINLFIWPETGDPEQAERVLERQGYHLIHWIQGGLSYWAVSDLNEKELKEFVELQRG